jgi:hypothetical protein
VRKTKGGKEGDREKRLAVTQPRRQREQKREMILDGPLILLALIVVTFAV